MRESTQKIIRLTLQGTVASAATYLLCVWTGVEQISWAVISALFVIQQSLDETLATAAGRLVGTLLGMLVGMLTIFVLGGETAVVWRLIIAACVMSAITSLRPSLSYGIVAATIVALETDPNVWGGAIERVSAIFLGAVVGSGVALGVWPQSAAASALRAVRAALDDCRELLEAEVDELLDEDNKKLGPIHDRFLGHLRTARSMAAAARVRSQPKGVSLQLLVRRLSRLWHALILIDRFLEHGNRPAAARNPDIAERVRDVRQAACVYLGRRADRGGKRAPSLDTLEQAIDRAADVAQASEGARELEPLIFGLRELGHNLKEMDELLCKLA